MKLGDQIANLLLEVKTRLDVSLRQCVYLELRRYNESPFSRNERLFVIDIRTWYANEVK